jgi:hypothetical protein
MTFDVEAPKPALQAAAEAEPAAPTASEPEPTRPSGGKPALRRVK